MKIVVLDGAVENPGDLSWDAFEQFGSVTVFDRTPKEDAAEILRRIGDAEAVISNKTPLRRETIERAKNLRYIGELATGYDNVDLVAARECGIPVTNVPGYGTTAVSQYTMAMLLEICHRIGHHDRTVHEGKWTSCQDFCYWDYPLIELAGKTMGIVGLGKIGIAVARLASAFGMQVIAYSRHETAAGRSVADYVPLEQLYARADVISLHCPLNESNAGMIGRAAIAQMKDGVILLNTGRGALVCEQDLADALCCGKVAAAGLDVVSTEPISADNPLLTAPNCLITPHIAWASKESRQRIMTIAAENLGAFLGGRSQNVVNP